MSRRQVNRVDLPLLHLSLVLVIVVALVRRTWWLALRMAGLYLAAGRAVWCGGRLVLCTVQGIKRKAVKR